MKRVRIIMSFILIFCFALMGCSQDVSKDTNISKDFSLKNMCFTVERGSILSTNPSDYVIGAGDVLENLVFDFSQVDMENDGMYYATVNDGENSYSFVVDVTENVNENEILVMSEVVESTAVVPIAYITCPANGQLTVAWEKIELASGYEIYQSGKENGKFVQIYPN